MKNRKRIVAVMILAVCSLGFAFAMWREGNLPVNPDNIPVMFVVIARGSDGEYIPAVLYEWSSYVQGSYRPPIYHKIRVTPDFDPHWAGMMIVSDDERSHYDFRVPVADVVQAENDLNNLPAAFGSNATYELEVHDSENGYATELTLYRSTNGSNTFRYRINDGSVTPLRFGGTGRFTSMVTLFVIGFLAVVAFFSMLSIALIRGNDPRFGGGEEGTVDGRENLYTLFPHVHTLFLSLLFLQLSRFRRPPLLCAPLRASAASALVFLTQCSESPTCFRRLSLVVVSPSIMEFTIRWRRTMSPRTMRAGSVVLAVVCCAAIPVHAQQNAPSPAQTPAITLYVSTNGNDAWSGTQPNSNADSSDRPCATLLRARDAVRELRKSETGVDKPVTVTVRGGTYLLDETLIL